MKAILIIDDIPQELDLELVDISFGKFEGQGVVILLQKTGTREIALGVGKPSGKGIADNVIPNTFVLRSVVAPGTLENKRALAGYVEVNVIPNAMNFPELVTLTTRDYDDATPDLFDKALDALVELEMEHVKDARLKVLGEPKVIVDKEKRTIYIQEVVVRQEVVVVKPFEGETKHDESTPV